MYLLITAVSDATIARLHADPPLVWQQRRRAPRPVQPGGDDAAGDL